VGGVHNQLNALAAIAAAQHVGVTPAVAAAALREFRNVKRRMEVRGIAGGVTVYDDFAHHPTAIRTTIDGLRRQVGAAAHPGGVRAAQQHDEAGHDEGAAALEPGAGRPGVLPRRRAGLGPAEALQPMGAKARVAQTSTNWWRR
jgi:UDP-N-acetylmuramate: L-alanyl-gamma-D-glutamyl-meso-diaminopimelate ligase